MAEITFGAGVAERDIDLLLLEEFYSSQSFRLWFLKKAGFSNVESLTFLSANHSVNSLNGESDLIIKFKGTENKEIWLLIEDKIAAPFQPNQIRRYNERALLFVEQNLCGSAYTILVAPENYAKKVSVDKYDIESFRAIISYQEIRDEILKDFDSNNDRQHYKVSLINKALSQKGPAVIIIPVQQFWTAYQTISLELYPELNLEAKPPSGRDNFWSYQPKNFLNLKGSHKVELVHKLFVVSRNGGYVDIQFSGFGDRLDILEEIFGQYLEPEMKIVTTGKSGSISIQVPDLFNESDFESQKEKVMISIQTVARMAEWFSKYNYLWNNYWTTHS
jgi:hypothetical protein